MKRLLPLLVSSIGCAVMLTAAEPASNVKLTALTDRVRIEIGGQLFSEYVFAGAKRPYFYPVLSSDGTSLVRDFPMKVTPGEDRDHPHHRALWFAHSSVNGIDFWNEDPAGGKTPKGTIEQRVPSLEVTSGTTGVIRTGNRWLSPEGKLICTDETTIRISGTPEGRLLDYEVTLHALADTPLLMGDNKDGVMAIRVPQWMTLPHKYQKADLPGKGHLVTSGGQRDGAAWGKRGEWCDYFAPHNGKVYGVAIFDHPQNLRHPTWWMARDYGLFAANPFGQHDFEGLKDQPHLGDHTIPAGGSFTLRYRFYFHNGDEVAAKVAEHYAAYAAGK